MTVMMSACGGGGGDLTDQQKAVNLIVSYADDNTSTRPTADDYDKAGIDLNGVDADAFSDYLAWLNTDGLTKADIEKIADEWNILIVDTDGDGVPNGIDNDDDGDGILDKDDSNATNPNDPVIGGALDTDGDGKPNGIDEDDDNDGVNDERDAFPLDKDESMDTDGDGTGDNADSDDDNDGISDKDEQKEGTDPKDPNSKPEKPFVFKVKTDNPGFSDVDDTQYIVYAMGAPAGTYSYSVDCNYDGTFEAPAEDQTSSYMCDYDSAGTYTIAIQGTYPRLRFGQSSPEKLVSVEQWGTQQWTSLYYAFNKCKNMVLNATDKPNLNSVTSLSGMFLHAEKFDTDIGDWDVHTIVDMEDMFTGAIVFNQDLSRWNVGAVTTMEQMFRGAESFNGEIGDWNTSNVETMENMFYRAFKFNQDIGGWDTSKVKSMSYLFYLAKDFNQSIDEWNTENTTKMDYMFGNAYSFDQPLSAWDVSSVIDMENMFMHARSFNQDISGWDTGKVEKMKMMFYYANSFSGHDLSGWDIHSVGDRHGSFGKEWGADNTEPDWQ
jgi:surface protein